MPEDLPLDKPLIAAVNGFAVGVGLTLVLQCQLRVMAEGAWLGDQHTNVGRLGTPHLKYAAPPRDTAAYMTLCTGRAGPHELLNQGVINRVTSREDLMSAAEELADMVCMGSPRAVQKVVELYRMTAAEPHIAAYARHLDQEIAEGPDGPRGRGPSA